MRAIGSVSPLLLVGPAWVGDMVMAASLVEVLRLRDPGRPVDVIAPPAALPIARMIRGVRRTIPLGLGHGELGLLARWRAGRALREEGYSKAIILPRAFKAAIIPFAAGIPERVGYKAELRSPLLTDARADRDRKSARTIDRFVALGLPEAAPAAPAPRPRLYLPDGMADLAAGKFPLPGPGPVLALCPGAEYGPSKRWPAEKFASLAARAAAAGWHVRVVGSAKEAPAGAVIAAAAPGIEDLTGRTTLMEAAAVLAAASVVVTNDSGLMHVASALDRRVVAVFGSSSEKMTPPTAPGARVISRPLPCRPCMKRECPLGTLACLEGIDAREVFDAAERIAR
ncbi:lipopolysaccharide heptosyltransferase II [Xanthobacter sp. KR7-225]|uniref:lipopolysaccharide heptosyltransferase II n=1 Tax=Xanthobacter sp. KR7-225 TaxID=3156613 RepID=UPI0032B49C9D